MKWVNDLMNISSTIFPKNGTIKKQYFCSLQNDLKMNKTGIFLYSLLLPLSVFSQEDGHGFFWEAQTFLPENT